ncbi:hypothetical protein KKA13_02980 [Patescibacteria group bacterium]|nr:hypothetical protein [Patescibacteria group bacterium]MBU1613422.1 hypothetical protein [Patescibacteria group bacterium]
MLIKDLQSIGFSKNLASIYLELVQLGGQAKAGEIIKKTGLHRNIVYISLEKLINKKLIYKIEERGVALYKTLEPVRIMNEIKEKEQMVANIIEELESIKKHPLTQEVTVYEGLDGFREYSTSSLKKMKDGETLHVLGSIGDKWYEFMGEKSCKQYEEIQLSKQIHWKMITYYISRRDNEFINQHPNLCSVKYLPQNYENPSNMLIFPDAIALQIFTEPFSVIEIKNKALSDVYLNYFNYLWNQEIQTFKGWKEMDQLFKSNLKPGYRHDVYGANYGEGGKEKVEQILQFYVDYHNKTAYLKPKKRLIFYDNQREEARREVGGTVLETRLNIQLRFLPERYYTPMETHVFDDRVILVFLFDEPTATVYTNPKIVTAYKKQFDLLWNTAR